VIRAGRATAARGRGLLASGEGADLGGGEGAVVEEELVHGALEELVGLRRVGAVDAAADGEGARAAAEDDGAAAVARADLHAVEVEEAAAVGALYGGGVHPVAVGSGQRAARAALPRWPRTSSVRPHWPSEK
jgi:hypothetical protein